MTSIDLPTAARLARDSACQEVKDTIEAAGRYYPGWEVQELGMSHAIRDGLLAYFRTLPEPRPRLAQEYGASVIGNVRIPFPRWFDLVVLRPLVPVANAPAPGYAWSTENTAVLGFIEVKKDSARAHEDAGRLSEIALLSHLPGQPPLEWVLLMVFFAGRDQEHVQHMVTKIQPVLGTLRLVTEIKPQRAPANPGSEQVSTPWFDVVGFGQTLPASVR